MKRPGSLSRNEGHPEVLTETDPNQESFRDVIANWSPSGDGSHSEVLTRTDLSQESYQETNEMSKRINMSTKGTTQWNEWKQYKHIMSRKNSIDDGNFNSPKFSVSRVSDTRFRNIWKFLLRTTLFTGLIGIDRGYISYDSAIVWCIRKFGLCKCKSSSQPSESSLVSPYMLYVVAMENVNV